MDHNPSHFKPPEWIRELADRARELSVRSCELLKVTTPDTFLGRKTQEPFPTEDPIERTDIQKLIHSELQPPRT